MGNNRYNVELLCVIFQFGFHELSETLTGTCDRGIRHLLVLFFREEDENAF